MTFWNVSILCLVWAFLLEMYAAAVAVEILVGEEALDRFIVNQLPIIRSELPAKWIICVVVFALDAVLGGEFD